MIAILVILYAITWIITIYTLITAPSDVELWSEEIE